MQNSTSKIIIQVLTIIAEIEPYESYFIIFKVESICYTTTAEYMWYSASMTSDSEIANKNEIVKCLSVYGINPDSSPHLNDIYNGNYYHKLYEAR